MSSIRSASPPSKRIKLEASASPILEKDDRADHEANHNGDTDFQCSICLQDIVDRTVIPTCSHEFCFECLMVWSEQSRRCPLCSRSIGDYLIHNIRSRYDYRKHYLAPLRTSPPPIQQRALSNDVARRRRTARQRERERRLRDEREEVDNLARSIERRRWIYNYDLYAKHVASNSYTRFRPYPTPAQFAASPDLISRTTTFLRRELQVWDDLDVEFLTTFTISMMKSIDIRSESAVKLLAEFLDMDAPYVEGGRHVNAEHFAHEVYSYVRSPFRDLFVYDSVVQYDMPPDAPLPPEHVRGRRWRELSRSRSRSRHSGRAFSNGRERSLSYSPSGRHYPSSRSRRLDMLTLSERHQRRSRERSVHHDSIHGTDHERAIDPEPIKTVKSADEENVHRTHRIRTAAAEGKERKETPKERTKTPKKFDSEPGPSRSQSAKTMDPQITHPSAAASTSEPKKRPRHRNLLESVHAHLGSTHHSSFHPGRKRSPEREHDTSSSPRKQPTALPSLLARLSDPKPSMLQDTAAVHTYASLTASQETESDRESQTFANATKLQPTRTLAPEVMAPTRAALAVNDGIGTFDPFSTVIQTASISGSRTAARPQRERPPGENPVWNLPDDKYSIPCKHGLSNFLSSASPPTDNSAHCDEQNMLQLSLSRLSANFRHQEPPSNVRHVGSQVMRGISVESDRPPNSTSICGKTHHAHSRTRLLTRLEKQKREVLAGAADQTSLRASSPAPPGVDGTSRTNDSNKRPLTAQQPAAMGTGVVDPRVMEARLKARAQLQVRLAAEKRSCGV